MDCSLLGSSVHGILQARILEWGAIAFSMMYATYKLNKEGDNIHTALSYSFPDLEPVCCSMSGSNCCFLTCIQISQEAGQVVWYSHLFQNFSKVCKRLSIILGPMHFSHCFVSLGRRRLLRRP